MIAPPSCRIRFMLERQSRVGIRNHHEGPLFSSFPVENRLLPQGGSLLRLSTAAK